MQIIFILKSRVEALYQLTGGTPRTLAILFPLIQNGFSEAIQTDLDALLDVVTPLYKARFEELAQQLQVVLDAVALHWDPINLEQLRQVTLLENAQLSPQLKRLVDVGWLQKLDAYQAKGAAYELSERFFNIWYLMRRSSRRQKRELYCLTKFLETFYGNDLSEIAKGRLECKAETPNQIALDLALADAVRESELSKKLKEKSYKKLMELSFKDSNILKNFSLPNSVTEEELRKIIETTSLLLHEQKYLDLELLLRHAIEINPQIVIPWMLLGELYSNFLNKDQEAEQAYKKAIEIDNSFGPTYTGLGNLYARKLGNYLEAEQVYNKALELDPNNHFAWYGLGILYANYLKKYSEAEIALKKSIELGEKSFLPWAELAKLYHNHLKQFENAKKAYIKVADLKGDNSFSWCSLGNLYTDELKEYQEAEHAYRKAIEIDESNAFAWYGLGNLYANYLNDYQNAETSFKKAIELNNSLHFVWMQLGVLYLERLERKLEAEQSFRKALELDPDNNIYLDRLANLYHDYLYNYKEAEATYLKSLKIAPSDLFNKYNLIFLWRDNLHKQEEAISLFETITKSDGAEDSYFLNQSLFAYYEKNIGIAENFLKDALQSVGDTLPSNTIDDWYRSVAVIIKLGFANSLLKVFFENGYDTIFRPFYVAIEAIAKKDDLYFNSIAAEVREPAKKIMERILAYMK